MKLSLVVPCYNEEDSIDMFYKAVKDSFTDRVTDFEIIFVNDGSKDNTLEKLRSIYRSGETKTKVINLSRNFGKESAMYAGLQQAVGEYVCIIDADLQQRPELVLEMMQILEEQPKIDCVAAYQKDRNEGRILSFFKKSFYKLINTMSEVEFRTGASDFRTFRQSVNKAIIGMQEYYRFSKGIFSWVGFEVYYMPYKVEERVGGTSKWSFRKLFRYAIDGIMAFTTAPLKIASTVGVVSILISIVYFIVYLLDYINNHQVMTSGQCLIGLVILFSGIQCIILGIIGGYLSRLYVQGKNRPIYIAKEILGYEENKDD